MDKITFNEYKAFVYELLERMSGTDAEEIKLEYDNVKIKLSKRARTAAAAAAAPAVREAVQLPEAAEKTAFKAVKSPLVGVAYTAPSPEAEPFVKAGSEIKKGDIVCIVEAMKVMNEIESDCDGIVEEILFKNGEAVEFGQPLIRLK